MRVARAAHLPVNNVMLSFIVVRTLLPTCSLGALEPCIMELTVVARAMVYMKNSDKIFHFEEMEVDELAKTNGFGR